MEYPPIDVWRMSASRPWQLKRTIDDLRNGLKYNGELRFHLIESFVVEEYSQQCVEIALEAGYDVYEIHPAQGQGFAMNFALNEVITTEFALKWEDDFRPDVPIPLDNCVALMQQYEHINQICFNKRQTLSTKYMTDNDGIIREWQKEQRFFHIDLFDTDIPLVVKEKWWFGPAIWRVGFIKPIFRYWPGNTHNYFNDIVLLPMAGFVPGKLENGKYIGRYVPTPKDIEEHIGCYIYGKHGDPRMAEHTGVGDSLWVGEFQAKMKSEGKEIMGI